MPEATLRLHLNENPYGAGRRVRKALERAAADAHVYPDLKPLCADIAAMWGVDADQVTVGAGGDDILRRAVDVSAGPVVAPWPSFSVYPILARARGRVFATVPPDDHGAADPDTLAELALSQARPGTVLLANPNNPTGGGRPREAYIAMARRLPAWLVVVDEAYADFRDVLEPTAGVDTWPENMIVARTLSKLHGLAGLRVGYAVGRGWGIKAVTDMGDEMSVGTLAVAGARASLADTARLGRVRAVSLGRRRQMTRLLMDLGFEVGPSETNFLLVRPPEGVDADRLWERLRQEGVRLRRGRDLGVPGALRISLGSGPQVRTLMTVLSRLVAAAGAATV